MSEKEDENQVIFPVEYDRFDPLDGTTIDDLDARWVELSRINFGENPENRKSLLKVLEEKVIEAGYEDSVKILVGRGSLELFYLKILRAGGFNIERSMSVLSNFLDILKTSWHYFENCTNMKIVEEVYKQNMHTMLAHRDKLGRRVYIYRPGVWDPDAFSFSDVFCAGYMLTELVALETKTQIAGVTNIADATGFGWKQLRAFTIDHARSSTHFIQDGFPVWFREIHVINAPRLFNLAYQLVKPFLNERIKNGIVFHSTLESLHEHVDASILPSELGGSMGPFSNAESVAALKLMPEYFENVRKYVLEEKEKKS